MQWVAEYMLQNPRSLAFSTATEIGRASGTSQSTVIRLALWGLSYGGYMTLAALTKYPEVFVLGINLASVWDLEQWAEWIDKQQPGIPNLFPSTLGWP